MMTTPPKIPWWASFVLASVASGLIGIALQHQYYKWREKREKEQMA